MAEAISYSQLPTRKSALQAAAAKQLENAGEEDEEAAEDGDEGEAESGGEEPTVDGEEGAVDDEEDEEEDQPKRKRRRRKRKRVIVPVNPRSHVAQCSAGTNKIPKKVNDHSRTWRVLLHISKPF